MWPETTIVSIEVLPNYTIQIDFEEEWKNHRCFVSFGEFFNKFGAAMSNFQKMFESYQKVNQYVAHLDRKIELLENDSDERLSDEKAIQEKNKVIADAWIDVDVFDMYIRWV